MLSEIEIARIRADARALLAAVKSGRVPDRILAGGFVLREVLEIRIDTCRRALAGNVQAAAWLARYQQRMQRIRARRLADGQAAARSRDEAIT